MWSFVPQRTAQQGHGAAPRDRSLEGQQRSNPEGRASLPRVSSACRGQRQGRSPGGQRRGPASPGVSSTCGGQRQGVRDGVNLPGVRGRGQPPGGQGWGRPPRGQLSLRGSEAGPISRGSEVGASLLGVRDGAGLPGVSSASPGSAQPPEGQGWGRPPRGQLGLRGSEAGLISQGSEQGASLLGVRDGAGLPGVSLASPGSAQPAGVRGGAACWPPGQPGTCHCPPLLPRPAGSRKPPRCCLHCVVTIGLLPVSADPLLKPEEKQQSISVNAESPIGVLAWQRLHCELRAGKPGSNTRPATGWAVLCFVCKMLHVQIY